MAMHHIQQGHTYANTAKTYLVNINGIGSDVDLTHWDVSHVSDAHKAVASV
jgi:hypothetical protein